MSLQSSTRDEASCPKCGGVFRDLNLCTYCGAGVRYNGRGFAFHATSMHCPRCITGDGAGPDSLPLYEIRYRDLSVDVCLACQGTWFDLGELEALVQNTRHDARNGVFEADAVGPSTGARPEGTQVAYLRCPKCETLMNRTNFEKRSGIIVDWCRPHGLWLDGGEIAQVRSWAATTPEGPPAPARARQRSRSSTLSPSSDLASAWAESISNHGGRRSHRFRSPLGSFVSFLIDLFV